MSHASLIEDLATEDRDGYFHDFKLKESGVGSRVLALSPEERCSFVVESLGWIERRDARAAEAARNGEDAPFDYRGTMAVRWSVTELLRRRMPFDERQVNGILDWSSRQQNNYMRNEPQMVKVVENHLKEHPLTPKLKEKIERLVEVIESGYNYDGAASRKRMSKLKDLAGLTENRVPLEEGEAWSDAAISDIESSDEEIRSAWISLLNLCATSSGSKPSDRWTKEAASLLARIGHAHFRDSVLRWFPLVNRPRTRHAERTYEWQPDPNLLISETNADVLKGLVWLCAEEEDGEVARALTDLAISAYKKVPQLGPRCVRVGNACVWALGEMPGTKAIGQLAVLKVKVKFGTARNGIEKALDAVAERESLPREEIEEMSVPTYGVTEVGLRRETFGEFSAEVVVTGTTSTELRWTRPDGKVQKSVPKKVKEEFPNELKELKGDAKDIQKLLSAQRDRIEGFYLQGKDWTYPAWRERYLDHPLVGTLTRRLIWTFSNGKNTTSGIWHDGDILDRQGNPLDRLDDGTHVTLWHPIGSSTEEVLAWRERLAEMEIRQPFKQAHREVYLLTDAERRTQTYSNRFAAHVLKQHQFNALCAARGWKYSLRLMVDDFYPPATRSLSHYGLRAEYWVEAIGEDFGTDTTEAGTYLYVATDQVRFYREDADENYAYAGGGGYFGPVRQRWFGLRRDRSPVEAMNLDEVPPLVFSEIMRDCDLFVGVASVGNDPNWDDGGPAGRYRDYWNNYSFGKLSETAKTRRDVLEKLVPRLRISDRCHFADRYLVVRGDFRTYRIHLGSGNILMEPDDQYLCIVPSPRTAGDLTGRVFLPFEGDNTLAIILSKAFMLADDTKIEDETILRQIQR